MLEDLELRGAESLTKFLRFIPFPLSSTHSSLLYTPFLFHPPLPLPPTSSPFLHQPPPPSSSVNSSNPFISLSPHLFFPLIFIFCVISFVAIFSCFFDHSSLNVPVILTNIFLHPSHPPPSVGSHSNSRESLHWLVTHCQNLRCFFMVTILMGLL